MSDLEVQQNRESLRNYYFLPLFYMIPREYLSVRKLDKFPRNPFVVVSNPKWRKLYQTVGWQAEVAEIWAFMIWPHLGIRGTPTHYTINDPFINMTYSLAMWAMLIAEMGMNCDMLAAITDRYNGELPYSSEAEAAHNCHRLADLFWRHPFFKAKQVFEIVQTRRDHKDFAPRRTAVYIDFLRKYYHTRTKYKSVSLQNTNGEHELIIEDNPDIDNVVGNDWIGKFYGWLDNKRDIEICKLLYIGYTQQQIADKLGYKNHSGVTKRISKIRDILTAFIEWQKDLEREPESESQSSAIRYDTIKFEYKRK